MIEVSITLSDSIISLSWSIEEFISLVVYMACIAGVWVTLMGSFALRSMGVINRNQSLVIIALSYVVMGSTIIVFMLLESGVL